MQRNNFDNVVWTSVKEMALTGELSCIDGRHDHCIVAAPGGNIGEFVLLMASAENLLKHEFTQTEVASVLEEYIQTFGRFYMHTDSLAVNGLMKTLIYEPELRTWVKSFNCDYQSFFTNLKKLKAPKTEILIDYLLMPEYTGCGHLKLLLKQSKKYCVRYTLLKNILTSFFQLMWQDNPRIHWEMLQGEHHEMAIVEIEASEELTHESAIPYACQQDSEQRYVIHSAARRFFQKQGVKRLNICLESLNLPKLDDALFIEEVNRLTEVQLNETLNRLAKGIPKYKLTVCGNTLDFDDVA